jgi:ribosomal protein S18 acetylase RimI-like enzyme
LPSLGDFRCAGSSPYEAEVEEIVAMLHAGQCWYANVRVAEDPTDGTLLGLCATQPRPFGDDPSEPDTAYIFLIAVNGTFRGYRTPDGARIGDVLLEDALREIREQWGRGPAPRIWALVAPSNSASHNLFDRHGFLKLDAAGSGYDIRFRSREEP